MWVVGEHFSSFWRVWKTLLAKGLGADRTDFFVAAGTVGALSLMFWPLYSSRMIPEHDGKIWSGGSCWADLPIHMHIAESFLQVRAGLAVVDGYAARDLRRWKGTRRVLVLAHARR